MKALLFSICVAGLTVYADAQSDGENSPVADPGWPKGAVEVANLPSRTWWDTPPGGPTEFLYQGDAKAFSEALAKFAAIRASAHELLLSDGTCCHRNGSNQPADWVFTVLEPVRFAQVNSNAIKNNWWSSDPDYHPEAPRMNLFVGGQVDWAQVKVPPGIYIEDQRSSAFQGSVQNSNPAQLSLNIRCTNTVLKAGDEIPIEFRITNTGADNYEYPNRTYDRSGRMDEYKLVAKTKSGEAIPDPRAKARAWMGGGGYKECILQPGATFTKTIPLNRWALVKEPGVYTVVGTYALATRTTNLVVINSEPITITILPRTDSEMNAYILDLSNQLAAIPPVKLITTTKMPENVRVTNSISDSAFDQPVMKLMYTCSPKIVPTLLQTMYEPASSGFWESEALQFYVPHSDNVRRTLIKTATERGFGTNLTMAYLLRNYGGPREEFKSLIERSLSTEHPTEWAQGADLAQVYWDDAFTRRLVSIAKTAGTNGRGEAVSALAFNRTDEGVKTLKELLNDPDPNIWVALADALQNGYLKQTNSTRILLRRGDFSAADMKPLIEHLLASDKQNPDVITGVSLDEQFGSDDFTGRLVAIATSPGNIARYNAICALAFNRTDEGLQTLKQLVNDPDEQIRTTTRRAIHYAYTDRGTARGRPLAQGDFPEIYHQP